MAEHHHVVIAATLVLHVRLIFRLIHAFQIGNAGFVDHGVDHFRLLMHQHPHQCHREYKGQGADQVPAPLPAHRLGEAAGDKGADAICQRWVVAVQLAMGTQYQIVEELLQLHAVASLPCQRQLVAELAVIGDKGVQGELVLLAHMQGLQLLELAFQCLPFRPVLLFETGLFHVGPCTR